MARCPRSAAQPDPRGHRCPERCPFKCAPTANQCCVIGPNLIEQMWFSLSDFQKCCPNNSTARPNTAVTPAVNVKRLQVCTSTGSTVHACWQNGKPPWCIAAARAHGRACELLSAEQRHGHLGVHLVLWLNQLGVGSLGGSLKPTLIRVV